ncbi:uncharacterized protein LOC123512692 [Portunus trituberculatus]|uniref:uncharacterized protein LOC123512692 n=1 Tax=Portunus trituberculatus TaxID=210409 RepID=UPI001E1CC00D|nr:uncharacterized protein LOC123512692 [Portunus trituberculatus]
MAENKAEASSPPSSEELPSPPAVEWQRETSPSVAERTSSRRQIWPEQRSDQMKEMYDHLMSTLQGVHRELAALYAPEATGRDHATQMSLKQNVSHAMASESPLTQRGDSSRFETQGQTPNQGEGDGRRNELTAPNGSVNLGAREPTTEASTSGNWMKEMTTIMQFNQRPVPTFKEGTCVEYWTFKDNFEKHVRSGNITDSRKLELLISAYSGSAKQDLHGCNRYADPTEGYQQAWLILNDRHGNQRKYIQFLVREVMYGPNLSLEDMEGVPSDNPEVKKETGTLMTSATQKEETLDKL